MILAMPTLIRELLNEVASIKQQTSTPPPNNSQSQIHNLVLEPSLWTIRHIQSRCPIHTIKTFLSLLLLQVSRAAVLQHHRDWVPSFSHHWLVPATCITAFNAHFLEQCNNDVLFFIRIGLAHQTNYDTSVLLFVNFIFSGINSYTIIHLGKPWMPTLEIFDLQDALELQTMS